ncbi:unnamed protein product [Larinioides sclopetarius]|uniref:Peptidase S1 domain-containing protein n=1 Tax=Larinioides sclopetarius TaxID=280406 RepID=A0AAV2BVN0_9ARAC
MRNLADHFKGDSSVQPVWFKGDSGSAIFAKFEKKYFALGITSFGLSQAEVLCSLDKPAAFTKVYHYMKWIKKYVKNIPNP